MAKLKMKPFPKKPKASASVETKKRYLDRVREIVAENKKRASTNAESDRLTKVIAGLNPKSSAVRVSTAKRKVAAKKKPAKKAAKRKRK